MGGCNITTKQSGNDVNPHIKKLSKEITEKYIYELVKEATKRAIEDQAEKIDEKKIQKLQQKIKELSDDQKTNLFKGSEDEISKIIHQKDLNSEKIIEKINTTFKKTLDLNVRSLLPGIILPISTKLLLIIIAITAIAFYGIPIIDDIINPDDPVENQLPELSIDPDPLNFNFGTMNEGDTDSRTFFISNTGSEILEWSITGNQPWIEVSQNTGTDSGTVSVIVNSAGMDPGRHTGRITVESNGGTETGRISLFIPRDNEPPEPTREPTAEPTLRPPRIHSFRANPDHIDVQGGETNLSWEVSDATSVIINGIEYVDVPTGSIQIWVSQTTNFTIRATNDAGISDVRTVRVTVEKQLPELSIDPDPLDLNYGTMNEGNINSRTFLILNTGRGTLEWSISDNRPWITTIPTGGINSKEVIVTVNTAELEPGNYSGNITIESNGGESKQGNISFAIKKKPPILSVYPDPLLFNFNIGPINTIDAFSNTFEISNIGGGTLEWKITTNQNWINVNPTEGIDSEEVTIRVKTVNLDAGSYNGTITINSNGGNMDIPVSLVIEPFIPAAPSQLTKSGDYPCEIEWIDNSENEDEFYIYIGYSNSCDENCKDITEWKHVASVGKDVTSYSWSESCCGVAQCSCVMVRAYNEIGESSNSNIIMLAPLC